MIQQESGISDERLVASTIEGDGGAFVELVGRYKHRIFGMAGRFTATREELEDLCQTIFVRVFENLGKFRKDAPFEHWISKIAVRACYDLLRSRKKTSCAPIGDLERHIADASAEESIKAFHAHQVLTWGLSQLGAKERMVITLLELEEKSVKEIAQITGWTESNVKVRAFRAREQLKRILGNHNAY